MAISPGSPLGELIEFISPGASEESLSRALRTGSKVNTPRNNFVAQIGHSMNRQVHDATYSGTANRIVPFRALAPFHIGALSRGQFIFPESCNFGVNGSLSRDMVQTPLTAATNPGSFAVGKTQVEAAIACIASTAIIFAEHNDRFNNITLNETMLNHRNAIEQLIAANMMVIVIAPTPTGNTGDPTRRLTGLQLGYHMAFRDWVLSDMQDLYPGQVIGVDPWPGLQDLSVASAAGDILVPAAVDSVHPSCFGGYGIARNFMNTVPNFVPKRSSRTGIRGDAFDAVSNPNGNLLGANASLIDVGTAWTGTAGGVTYSGTRPTTWNQIGPNGALQAGTFTITGTMVDLPNGRWWQCRIQGTAGAAGGNITIGPPNLTLANLNAGDKVAAYGEFEIDASGTGLSALALRLLANLPNSESNAVFLGEGDTSNKSWDNILALGKYEGTWNGDVPITITKNETALALALQPRVTPNATVDFTFRVRLISVRKGGVS